MADYCVMKLPEPLAAEFERRYRAVLCADMVAYTRLMEAEELETHSRFRQLKVSIVDPIVVSHRGEIVKGTGDGFIAVFESPRDALCCAIEAQAEITTAEFGQHIDRRIAFRMGLHWEPIILDGNDVFGSGVNIASRLQAVAPPGGVVASQDLLTQIEGELPASFQDLGDLRLKNLYRPVRAAALLLPGQRLSMGAGRRSDGTGLARLPSLAVLPFRNLSPETNTEFISSGFVEDVIAALSTVPELLVVARASTFSFREADTNSIVVAEKLGVRYLLRGSVRRVGDHVRIMVEFVDASSGELIWAERYDVGMHEIFDAQDEVAQKVVSKIARGLQRREIKRALRSPPQNLNAYDFFIRALDLLYRLDYENFAQARELLQRAQDEDPGYSAAFAYAAHWHMIRICEGWSTNPEVDTDQFMSLSKLALDRDPENALALTIQGHGRAMFFREHEAAMEMFDRALKASPSNSWAWVFSSGTYGFIGQAQSGVDRAERAIRLSPLDQQSFFNYCLLAQNHYINGTVQEAARWSRRSLNLNPRFGNALRVQCASLVALGRDEEARQVAAFHNQLLPNFYLSEYGERCPFKLDDARLYVERLGKSGITA